MADTSKVEVIKDILPVALTDEERLEFANELAKANQAVEHAIDEKKYLNSQAGAKVKQAEAHRDEITNIVSSGKEWREVIVHRVFDYDKGIVTETRTDTGEVIASRQLTDHEKQGNLLDELPEAEEAADEQPEGAEAPADESSEEKAAENDDDKKE